MPMFTYYSYKLNYSFCMSYQLKSNKKNGLKKDKYNSSYATQIKCLKRQLTINSYHKIQLSDKNSENIFQTQFTDNNFQSLVLLNIEGLRILTLSKMKAPLLQKFILSSTDTNDLSQFASENYPSLQEIKIAHAYLKFLPKFKCRNLEKLNILYNKLPLQIQEFSQGNYPQLKEIELYECYVEKIFQFPYCSKLQCINLGNNYQGKIKQISEFIQGNYPNLTKIEAPRNKIWILPSLSKYKNIQKLFFSNNCIKILQFSQTDKYQNIKVIDLSGNKIEKFPECLSTLNYPNLEHLLLNCNQIEYVPLINANNLVVVNFSANKIKSIQGFASKKYEKLLHFYISQNQLKEVPIINAPNLQTLSIFQNNIFQQNEVQKQMLQSNAVQNMIQKSNLRQQKLKQFQCQANQLQKIPKFLTLYGIHALSQITLNKNRIKNIELLGQIDLRLVRKMLLHENQIVSFEIFSKLQLPNIRELSLNYNKSNTRECMARTQFDFQRMKIIESTTSAFHDLNYLFRQQLWIKAILPDSLYYEYASLSSIIDLKNYLKKKKLLSVHRIDFLFLETLSRKGA